MFLLLVPILSLFREFLDQGNQAIDKNNKTDYLISFADSNIHCTMANTSAFNYKVFKNST